MTCPGFFSTSDPASLAIAVCVAALALARACSSAPTSCWRGPPLFRPPRAGELYSRIGSERGSGSRLPATARPTRHSCAQLASGGHLGGRWPAARPADAEQCPSSSAAFWRQALCADQKAVPASVPHQHQLDIGRPLHGRPSPAAGGSGRSPCVECALNHKQSTGTRHGTRGVSLCGCDSIKLLHQSTWSPYNAYMAHVKFSIDGGASCMWSWPKLFEDHKDPKTH